MEVSIDGIRTSADETTVFWDAVKAFEFKESSFGNALVVTHPEKNALGPGAKTTKIKLRSEKMQGPVQRCGGSLLATAPDHAGAPARSLIVPQEAAAEDLNATDCY